MKGPECDDIEVHYIDQSLKAWYGWVAHRPVILDAFTGSWRSRRNFRLAMTTPPVFSGKPMGGTV